MRNHIRKYYPAFVDIDHDPEEADFETTEQLLAIPWVKSCSDPHRDLVVKDLLSRMERTIKADVFHRFSISPAMVIDGKQIAKPLLMVEYDEGRKRFVVGFLDTAAEIELPILKPGE
jgi:hypothetical protein